MHRRYDDEHDRFIRLKENVQKIKKKRFNDLYGKLGNVCAD